VSYKYFKNKLFCCYELHFTPVISQGLIIVEFILFLQIKSKLHYLQFDINCMQTNKNFS
jgi:hypothetical protein